MDFDDVHLSLFSDEYADLSANAVEISTLDEQEVASALSPNLRSPKSVAQDGNLLSVKRQSKYDQISVVKVEDQVYSTKILSIPDNRICLTAEALEESTVLQSILLPNNKDKNLAKSNMHTTRTVPNILRNNLSKENSSSITVSEVDKYSTLVDVMHGTRNIDKTETEKKCTKEGVHKRKQVISSLSIREESPDWLSDILTKQDYVGSSDAIEKRTKKRKLAKPRAVERGSQKARKQKNCFLPLTDNETLNSTEHIGLFDDFLFEPDIGENSLSALLNYPDDFASDNIHTEFYNTDYSEYCNDSIVSSDKLDSLLNWTMDSCTQGDTSDINGNDINISQMMSPVNKQCYECENEILNELSFSVGAYEEVVEDSQLNDTRAPKPYHQSQTESFVTFNADRQNECITDSQTFKSCLSEKCASEEKSNELSELTDVEKEKEICTYPKEDQTQDLCALWTGNSDNENNMEKYGKKNSLAIDDTHSQKTEEGLENCASSDTIRIRNNSNRIEGTVRVNGRRRTKNERKCRSFEKFQCPICSLSFRTQRTVAMHKAAAHGGLYVIVCEYCGRLFNNKYHLNRHTVYCGFVQSPFQCIYCDRYYRHKSSLVQHLKNVHGITYTSDKLKQYICTKCSKVYTKFGAFQKHVTLHD